MTRHLRLTARNQYSWKLRNNHSTSINSSIFIESNILLPLFSGLPRWKHVLKTSRRFTAPRESFAVGFVVIKHFGRESLHVEASWGLDVVEYKLKCVLC